MVFGSQLRVEDANVAAKAPRREYPPSTLEVKRIYGTDTLPDVKTRHLIINYLGVMWTSIDDVRMLQRDRISAKNICLLLFLLFRRIGEATPTIHALFAGFYEAEMRIN